MLKMSLNLVLCIIALFSASLADELGSDGKSIPEFHVAQTIKEMPLAFTQNKGQWPDTIFFKANTGTATMWFSRCRAYYQFTRQKPHGEGIIQDRVVPDNIETIMIKASFVGANPISTAVGQDLMAYKCNFFLGNDPLKWQTDVPNYNSIVFRDIYSGIDLKYYGNRRQMEYDFIVSPWADPSQIAINYEGADSISVNNDGDLVVATDWGKVVEHKPLVYQILENQCVPVECTYSLIGENTFGFEFKNGYNAAFALVIDPVMVFSTYLGTNDYDNSWDIAVDMENNIYVTGCTYSSVFPTQDPFQSNHGGGVEDAYITKINAEESTLIYSSYFGGDGTDWGNSIALDTAGNIYVTGITGSSNFPCHVPLQSDFGGGSSDAFITKLNSSGDALIFSTYYGGTGNDQGMALTADKEGNTLVAGHTTSADLFLTNPIQASHGGGSDGFVVKINSDGSDYVYSTYLGGSEWDAAYSIAVDNDNYAHIIGATESSTDFPLYNAIQISFGGGSHDAFVVEIDANGDDFIYSTYVGGSDEDYGDGIAVDSSGNSYLTGYTYSDDYPLMNPYQGTINGSGDIFVTKLGAIGDTILYSTFLGGSDSGDVCCDRDQGREIAVNSKGIAYVTGYTYSHDFPLVNAVQASYEGGNGDLFVAGLSAAGDNLIFSSYLGGSGEDWANGITVDTKGDIYLCGWTNSPDYDVINAYDGIYNSSMDCFVTKISQSMIKSVQPGKNETNANIDSNIEASFLVDMNSSTINDTSFIVCGGLSGCYTGAISYDAPSRTATFDPDTDFKPGEVITVYLTKSIESSGGVPMTSGYTWRFTVAVEKGSGHLVIDSAYSTGDQPKSICAADFDKDGNVDLATANYNDGTVMVLLGNGDGTFAPKQGYPADSRPYAVATADLNNDGYPDLVTGNYWGDNIAVLINQGDGTFIRDNLYSIGDQVSSVACGDFDGDGHIDLAVAFNSGMSVLLNDGDAGFAVDTTYHGGFVPQTLAVADYDNDGTPDIISGNSGLAGVAVFYNDGFGKFNSIQNIATGTSVTGMNLNDFDADGVLDIATANSGINSVCLILDGLLSDTYAAGTKTWNPIGGDFDADSDIDLFAVNETDDNLTSLNNNGDGTFASRPSYDCGLTPSWGVAADFNHDGDLDVAVCLFGRDSIYVLSNISGFAVSGNSDAGNGSLRWALNSANSNPGSDTVVFLTAGTIEPLSPLPVITDDSLVISEKYSYYSDIHSVIIGSTAKAVTGDGLSIQSSGNLAQGLVFTGFAGNGIEITGASSTNNTLSKNLIYNNGLLGIDLGDDGVTANDPFDADTGPNDLLNTPYIDSVFMNPDSSFNIYGTNRADSAIIEFFVAHPGNDGSKPEDPTGHGEAYQYIGTDTANIPGSFSFVIPNTVPPFSRISMTATDTLGNTSEFGENFTLTPAPLIIVGYSPINLQVTDPHGGFIGRDAFGTLTQTIYPASYTDDVNDSIHIDYPLEGQYIIDVIGEDGADPGAVYSIGIRIDGTANCIIVEDALIPAEGEVTSYDYEVEEGYHYINGDVNRDEVINLLDILYLIDYKFKHGPEPYPVYAADADCNLVINLLDILYLIDYKFKEGPEPCPLVE